MTSVAELVSVYKRYNFEQAKTNVEDVVVFTIRSGYYHNADIVPLSPHADVEKVFDDFKKSGYACKIREFYKIENIERNLFQGYFTVDSTKKRLRNEYKKFEKNVLSVYSDSATYKYIESSYHINENKGESSVVSEIINKLSDNKPILFLIEAAAGFGKTCTAYEVLKKIISICDDKIPLFSELHRNRQAKIFRYVLLDEIDRSFPSLSSSLVHSEILNGNVPVLLDGFDELLRSNDDGKGFENTEPMLETIGNLLQKSAKIILTTRRTAIFDGDEFHEWIESHATDFEVLRIRLLEPTVAQWLEAERLSALKEIEFPLERISNPVLLSYLRCVSDDDFNTACRNPDLIVDKYFESMLSRESIRQDLLMGPSKQYIILKKIASDMIEKNYTSAGREDIVALINENFKDMVEHTRQTYPVDSRPSVDELINKIANHAMLDRSSDQSKEIGFVNEFVLGNFCADIIIEDESKEWVGDSIFIEPAVLSYVPRVDEKKLNLLRALNFCLEFQDDSSKFDINLKLKSNISYKLDGATIENLIIEVNELGVNNKILNSIFINCTFNCVFIDLNNFVNVSFMNCVFYNCKLNSDSNENSINFLGCQSDNDIIPSEENSILDNSELIDSSYSDSEIYVLEKFLPIGREVAHKYRAISGICAINNYFSHKDIIDGIENLKKKNILLNAKKTNFLQLNMNDMAKIKKVLGRI